MRHVHLIDTSVASNNVGDEVIVDEARAQLLPAIGDAYITTSSGHDGLGRYSRRHAAEADLVFLLGTNALSARFRGSRFIWRVTYRDVAVLRKKVVLVGVGATKDFEHVTRRQIRRLRALLSPDHVHSVRDDLAGQILSACGLRHANTSCPTLWRFSDRKPDLPPAHSGTVCMTLNGKKRHASDAEMFDILRRRYDEVFFWAQQPVDHDYLNAVRGDHPVGIVPPNLPAYDAFLRERRPDVVGTRLHGGIRALAANCPVLVVSIDNRAREIGRDTGLPIVARDNLAAGLTAWIDRPPEAALSIDGRVIQAFLDQFRAADPVRRDAARPRLD